LVPVNLELKL